MFATLFIIIGSIILTWVYYRVSRKNFLLKIRNIPEIEHYPIIGSTHLFIGKSPEELFNEIVKKMLAGPNTVKAFVLSKLFISVKNPDDIQKILTSPHCYAKGSPYDIYPTRNGLITAEPTIWKTHRKMLNSTIHLSLLKTFVEQFNQVSKCLVTDLQCKTGMNMFDIAPSLGYRITDLQLKTMFDAQLNEIQTRTIFENNKKILELWGAKIIKVHKHFLISLIKKLLKMEQTDEKIMNDNFKQIGPLIQKANKQYFETLQCPPTPENTVEEDIKFKPERFIHRLVRLVDRGFITERDMRDHIETFLLAGTDTLTVSLSNCLLCLAMNPGAQEKCFDEIKTVKFDKLDTISIDDLSKFEVLDRTINECLRLLPTVSIILRKPDKDIQLNDGKVIPANTDVLILLAVIHHSKEFWGENPTRLNPDNFLPENIAKRPLLSFIPYSYGLRNCIAKKYAQYALKIFLAHLLANYKFSTDLKYEELKMSFGITTILRNKHMIRIEKR